MVRKRTSLLEKSRILCKVFLMARSFSLEFSLTMTKTYFKKFSAFCEAMLKIEGTKCLRYQYAVRTWHRVRQELADYDSTDMGRALPRGMLIENRHRTRQYAHTATDDRRSSINSPPPLEESEEEGDA